MKFPGVYAASHPLHPQWFIFTLQNPSEGGRLQLRQFHKAINYVADAEIAFRYLITELVAVYKQKLNEISFRL